MVSPRTFVSRAHWTSNAGGEMSPDLPLLVKRRHVHVGRHRDREGNPDTVALPDGGGPCSERRPSRGAPRPNRLGQRCPCTQGRHQTRHNGRHPQVNKHPRACPALSPAPPKRLVDNAGNEILRFGRYGNFDSQYAGVAQPPRGAGPLIVRARVGSGAALERNLGWDGNALGSTLVGLAVGPQGEVYVVLSDGTWGRSEVRVLDGNGRYLRTIMPCPATTPKECARPRWGRSGWTGSGCLPCKTAAAIRWPPSSAG